MVVRGKAGSANSWGAMEMVRWGRNDSCPSCPSLLPASMEDKAVSCSALSVQEQRSVKLVPGLWGAEIAI